MAHLLSLAAAPAPPAHIARPSAPPPERRPQLRLVDTARLGECDLARWEDDGGAVLQSAELAA